MMPTLPRRRRGYAAPELPTIVEEEAEERRFNPPVTPFPDPLSLECVLQLQQDEYIVVEGREQNGVFRCLGGAVLKHGDKKIYFANYTTPYNTAPEREALHIKNNVVEWRHSPCTVRHPSAHELATLEERKLTSPPLEEETGKEKRDKPSLSAREIALALLKVVTTTPKGRVQLCKEAGIEISKEVAMAVLTALANAGKIQKRIAVQGNLKVIQWVKET